MTHQKALEILIKLIGKNKFKGEEKEAILTSVGVLSWTKLAGAKIKRMGERR